MKYITSIKNSHSLYFSVLGVVFLLCSSDVGRPPFVLPFLASKLLKKVANTSPPVFPDMTFVPS